VVTTTAKRAVVRCLVHSFEMSQRCACAALSFLRWTCRHVGRPGRDEGLRKRLRELAAKRPRYGYRRLGVLLRREGLLVNHKRVHRL
jgi:putative transposase